MDTYFDEDAEPPRPRPLEDIPAFPFPIEPIDISLARWQVASRIGKLPFDGYEACTRSLWLVFAGDWGVWVRAVIPVDNRLDAEDRAALVAKSAEAADLLGEPECFGVAIAAVVLRRPSPVKPTPADRQIFRLLTKAAATRDTVPWSFYVAGPDGAMPLLTRADRERYGLVRLSAPRAIGRFRRDLPDKSEMLPYGHTETQPISRRYGDRSNHYRDRIRVLEED
jgi:hypothetical protein